MIAEYMLTDHEGGGSLPSTLSNTEFPGRCAALSGLFVGGPMRAAGIVASIVSTIVLVALLVLVVAFAGVRLAGLTPYAVLSGSMEPLYPVGSLIYVQDVDPVTIQPGDSVTFEKGDGVVATHQAYEVDADAQEIRTQGIANINTDGSVMHDAEPVSFSSVIGVPVACVPLLGYVNSFVTSTVGTFVVVAGAVVAVALSVFAGRSKGRPVPASKHMRQ